ncbi:hypothetical protein, partial [Brevibacillus borstelensis]|uniref:hypothetical protein n=1 Tax=Brevibacillus borstelensis TaxID=45462 RepID=UPI00193D0204
MTVLYITNSGKHTSGSATISVNKPSGTRQGDIMLAIINIANASANLSLPNGWVSLASQDFIRMKLFLC